MLYQLKTTQFLKSDLQTVWNFMSSPLNLAKITPKYMGFHILSNVEDLKRMYPGQIIEYHVSPLFGIKLHWVTEITHVEHLKYFVDEQRFGPYAFWHHKHFLKEVNGGVEMIDIIHYKLPLGILGKLANILFVSKQLKEVFQHRERELELLYNQSK